MRPLLEESLDSMTEREGLVAAGMCTGGLQGHVDSAVTYYMATDAGLYFVQKEKRGLFRTTARAACVRESEVTGAFIMGMPAFVGKTPAEMASLKIFTAADGPAAADGKNWHAFFTFEDVFGDGSAWEQAEVVGKALGVSFA